MAQLEPDASGKRGPRKFFATEKEALTYLRQARAERDRGVDHSKKDSAMGGYLLMWLDLEKSTKAPMTYSNHRNNIRVITEHIGKVKIKALTGMQTQAMFNRLLDTYAISSVHGIRTTLNCALNKAVDWGILAANPARTGSELPPIPKTKITVFDETQIQAFLSVIEGHYLEMFFIVAMWLGLRRGELFNLRWQDIDFDNRVMHIRGSAQRLVGKGMVRGATKSTSGVRTIPIDDSLIVLLRAHKAAQMRQRLVKQWRDEGIVFLSTRGKILDPTSVTEAFKRLLASADLPLTTRIHDLRHTAITQMLANGGRIVDVSEIAGHSSPTITLGVYGHALEDSKRSAIEGMGKVMKRKKA